MFAVSVEDILVDTRSAGLQAGAEFVGENLVAKLLRGQNLALVECQSDGEPMASRALLQLRTGRIDYVRCHCFLLVSVCQETIRRTDYRQIADRLKNC